MSKQPNLVSLETRIPELVLDVRYFGSDNFVGAPIDGYRTAKALLTEEATLALAQVQKAALKQGYALKIFDAYRPQSAVDHFIRWSQDLNEDSTKSQYYPNIAKARLFEAGYLAKRSGHSRGSTVDLTLVYADTGKELDMGSIFDFFDPISWPSSNQISAEAQQNRQRLRVLMKEQGFVPFESEWWHFTLENEPYPERYFDIPVE